MIKLKNILSEAVPGVSKTDEAKALPLVRALNEVSNDIRNLDYKETIKWGLKNESKINKIIKLATELRKSIKGI